MNLALYLHTAGMGGLIVELIFAALIIWVIFYVLPLPPIVRTILAVAIAVVLVLTLLPGCSTTDPATKAGLSAAGKVALQDAAQYLGSAATQALFSVAQQELSGGKADFGQAAAAGLWSQVDSQTTGKVVGDIVTAYSAGKATQTAQAAANAASHAVSPAGGQQDGLAVTRAIAAVISTATGAPPAQ
jgi:hypothetical protein